MIEVTLRGQPPSATDAWDAAHRLGRRLVDRHALALCEVTVNDNRKRMLWWRITSIQAAVSAHWSIIGHTDDLIAVLDHVPGAWERLQRHLPSHAPPPLEPRGRVHDLDALTRAELAHVPDVPPVDVTWGRWPNRAPRRSLRLGSCEGTLVRIHPVLDHETVPDWFVGFILFHELLHAAMPTKVVGGRRQIHPPAFRRREAAHPRYHDALAWEQRHIVRLLNRAAAAVRRR